VHNSRKLALTTAGSALLLLPFVAAPDALASQPTAAPSAVSQDRSEPAAATRWGSLAFSPSRLTWGSGLSTLNAFTAESYAVNYCHSTGAGDCKTAMTWSNSWGSIAVSWANGPVGTGRASTRNQSDINALYYCRVYGGGNSCHVATSLDATPTR
jgi:Domain of unknown function (DUF4189)